MYFNFKLSFRAPILPMLTLLFPARAVATPPASSTASSFYFRFATTTFLTALDIAAAILVKLKLKPGHIIWQLTNPLQSLRPGFNFHHAKGDYVMVTKWLPSTPSQLPHFAHTQVGVGDHSACFSLSFSSTSRILLLPIHAMRI